MRRAYIEAHCTLEESFKVALTWAGSGATTLMAPSTSAVEDLPWLECAGVPIGTVGNWHSRFTARPHGMVIAWCLHLEEILDIEGGRNIDGILLVQACGQHAPWITAHDAEHIGGKVVPDVPEASAAVRAMVEGISREPIRNQGLVDSRERSTAVQALTEFHQRGHRLDGPQLITEALRNHWPQRASIEFAQLAREIKAGKRLQFEPRLRPEVIGMWASTR